MADGKQIVHAVAPTLRRAFLKALDLKGDRDGMTLPQIMLGLIDEHGLLPVLDRVAKFQEKTADINLNHSGEVTSLVQVLTSFAEIPGHDTEVASEPERLRH
jgi:hypothetical protein